MADINKVIRVGDTLTNIIDSVTKKSVNYRKVTTWYDGSPMTNEKVDGVLYRKKGSEYFRQIIDKDGELFLEKDTMAQMKALSSTERLFLKAGVFKGIQLNGYYSKGDTPAPIQYFLSTTSAIDNGGSVIGVSDIKLEHEFIGDVNIQYFGAKKSDKTFDNGIVFNKLASFISNGNKMATSNGLPITVIVPNGVFYFSTPSFFSKNYLNIQGQGNAVLCATDEFPKNTKDAIINLAISGECNISTITGITFTMDGGNPYNNYTGKFGSGTDYNYSTSVCGLRVSDMHYYTISRCDFVGLRLGIWLEGAWGGQIRKCNFQWNNRHLQSSQVTGRNSNWINVDYCVFGNSMMNGGIALIEANLMSFTFCDFEQAFSTAICTKLCQQIKFSDCYIEVNSKSERKASNSFKYQATPFVVSGKPDDAFDVNFDGYHIADDASRNAYTFKDCLFAIPTETTLGYVYQRSTRVKMVFYNCQLQSASTASENFMMLVVASSATSIARGFKLVDCSIRHPAKLSNSPLVEVQDTSQYISPDYNRSNVFYVDLVNGNDNIEADQIKENTPVKNLLSLTNWLPKDNRCQFTIYVKGLRTFEAQLINASFTNGGCLTIIGEGRAETNIGRINLLSGSRGCIKFQDMSLLSISDVIVDSIYDKNINSYNGLNIYLENVLINSTQTFGAINICGYGNQISSAKLFINNCTIDSTSAQFMQVRNGLDLYVSNSVLNKPFLLSGLGNIYYRNINRVPNRSATAIGSIVNTEYNIQPMASIADISEVDLANVSATELSEIVTYINSTVVPLVNAIKASQNTELTNQRTAGQQTS